MTSQWDIYEDHILQNRQMRQIAQTTYLQTVVYSMCRSTSKVILKNTHQYINRQLNMEPAFSIIKGITSGPDTMGGEATSLYTKIPFYNQT